MPRGSTAAWLGPVELPAGTLPLALTDRPSRAGKELGNSSEGIYGHVGDKAL